MLARIQQAIALGILIFGVAWVSAFASAGRVLMAIAGPVSVIAIYAAALAAEFIWLRRSYPANGTPGSPSPRSLIRAWWREIACAPRVFLWSQPFRSRLHADRPGRPGERSVVLVHGFFCNRGFWNPWLRRLSDAGIPFVAINLEPIFGSIDSYVAGIEDAVVRLHLSTGRPPLLVAHSMGGLAVRAWLHRQGDDTRWPEIVTIGTPHAGTWMGRFARSTNAREMGLGSDWLTALREAETDAHRARFTCWWSDCDNIVFPTEGATLPGADNRLVRGEPHVALAFHPPILDDVLRRLRSPEGIPASPRATG